MILSLLASIHAFLAAPNSLELHLRADTGVVQDPSGRVVLWKDLSGRGTHFGIPVTNARSDSALCPTVRLSGVGGRPSIHFAGSNALVDTSWLPLDSGATVFIMAQDDALGDAQSSMLDKGAGDLHLNLWDSNVGNLNFGISWGGEIATSSFRTSALALYEASWCDSASRLYANDSLLTSVSHSVLPTVTRNRRTWLGGDYGKSGLGYFLKGEISEVRVYRGVLPDSVRKQIADSMMIRYGIGVKPQSPLMLHLRADNGVVLDAKGRVVLWKDLSPRGTNFGVPLVGGSLDSILCPTVRAAGLGGKASVHFSGNSTLMDTSWLPLDSGATILIVAQDSGAEEAKSALLDKGRDDLHLNLWAGSTGSLNFGASWLAEFVSSNFRTAAPAVYEVSYKSLGEGGEARLFANSKLLDSGHVTTSGRNRITWLGADHDDNNLGYFLKGEISEVLVYRGVLSVLERKSVEAELMARYNLVPITVGVQQSIARKAVTATFHNGEIVLNGAHALELSDLQGRHIPYVRRPSAQGEVLSVVGAGTSRIYLLRTNLGSMRVLDTGR